MSDPVKKDEEDEGITKITALDKVLNVSQRVMLVVDSASDTTQLSNLDWSRRCAMPARTSLLILGGEGLAPSQKTPLSLQKMRLRETRKRKQHVGVSKLAPGQNKMAWSTAPVMAQGYSSMAPCASYLAATASHRHLNPPGCLPSHLLPSLHPACDTVLQTEPEVARFEIRGEPS